MSTYNPYEIIDRPRLGVFDGLPSAPPGAVLVVDREGQPLRALLSHSDRLTAGEARWGRIRTLYRVDVAEHQLEFEDTFPCKDDIGGFRASVKFTCRVIAAEEVVRRGIRDVTRTLVPVLIETLRRTCEDFAAENYDEAERAAHAAVRARESEDRHDPAFEISQISIVLTLDEAAAKFVRERKETIRNIVREQDASRLAKEKAQLEVDLLKTREQLEAEREKLAAGFENERLKLQQVREQYDHELAAQRQELELARASARARTEQQTSSELEMDRLESQMLLQKKQAELDNAKLELDIQRAKLEAEFEIRRLEATLEREKLQIAQYVDMLSQGEVAGLAMRLVQDPAAIGPISNYLADVRVADTNQRLQALRMLLDNDGLEGWQITEQAKVILTQLLDIWSARMPPLTAESSHRRSLDAPDASTAAASATATDGVDVDVTVDLRDVASEAADAPLSGDGRGVPHAADEPKTGPELQG
jgi:hypothetical protein